MAAVRRRHDGSPTRPTISGSRGRCSRSSGQVPAVLNSKPCLLAAPRNDNANRHSGPGCGYERPVPHDDEAGASGMVNAGRRLPLVPRCGSIGTFPPSPTHVPSAFRSDLHEQWDRSRPDRTAVADHDGQGGALAQDAAPRVPRRQGVRVDRATRRRSWMPGCGTTTTSDRTSRSGGCRPSNGSVSPSRDPGPPRSTSRAPTSQAGDDAAGQRQGHDQLRHRALQGRGLAGRPDRRGRLRGRARAAPPPGRAGRHPRSPAPDRQADRRAATRPPAAASHAKAVTAASVTRKVDSSGNVCFAGANYRVGSKLPAPPSPSRRRRRHRRDLASATSSSAATPSSTTAPANTAPSPTPAAAPTASTPPEGPTVGQVPGPDCRAGTGA